ncbi:MAG: hypothetical protein LBE81_02680 [Azonexus sp.]|jgi:predicted RNA-binding Zn-ribbon protein involved in translation (DUF1610 family)|uniref:hypothetical protein n=1 Tax=Azonexus sp. TaxID=1872668 RepID=UPI00283726BA|nr:hypothetical protein [Azonexus sp.]MDR0775525.1 hypothetical protein [Azonexus sp.]
MQTKKFNIDELTLEEMQPRQEDPEPSNIGRQCLKCEHVRLASESHAPAYACPACGAVYEKVEQTLFKQPPRT